MIVSMTWLFVCLSIHSWGNNIQTCVESIRASINLIVPLHVVGSTDNNVSGKKAHLSSPFKNCPIRQRHRHTQMSVFQWFGQSEGPSISWNWGNSPQLIFILAVSVKTTYFRLLATVLTLLLAYCICIAFSTYNLSKNLNSKFTILYSPHPKNKSQIKKVKCL